MFNEEIGQISRNGAGFKFGVRGQYMRGECSDSPEQLLVFRKNHSDEENCLQCIGHIALRVNFS